MEGLGVGRIVIYRVPRELYREGVEADRAAIVTTVYTDQGIVGLYVFPTPGNGVGEIASSIAHCPEQTTTANPSWHWPPRV